MPVLYVMLLSIWEPFKMLNNCLTNIKTQIVWFILSVTYFVVLKSFDNRIKIKILNRKRRGKFLQRGQNQKTLKIKKKFTATISRYRFFISFWIILVFHDLFIYILCIWVFRLHVDPCITCVMCPWRSEEGTGSTGTRFL